MTSFGANPVETVLGGDVALLDAVVEGFYVAGDAQRVRFFRIDEWWMWISKSSWALPTANESRG